MDPGDHSGGFGILSDWVAPRSPRFHYHRNGKCTHVFGLGLVVPIRKGREIIGVLKCNLNILGSISELISGENHQLLGKLKLVRSGGMVVFEEGFEPLSAKIHRSIFEID